MTLKGSYENHKNELKALHAGKQYIHLTMATREYIPF